MAERRIKNSARALVLEVAPGPGGYTYVVATIRGLGLCRFPMYPSEAKTWESALRAGTVTGLDLNITVSIEAVYTPLPDDGRGVASDRCEVGNACGRTGCPEHQS